jgi:hypothetical protein
MEDESSSSSNQVGVELMILALELVLVFAMSFAMLLWIGSLYVVVAVMVAIICTLLLLRPGKGPGWVPGFLIILFGFSLGIFWPSLPLVIWKGDAKRRRAIDEARRRGEASSETAATPVA